MKYIDLELREKTKRKFQDIAPKYPAFVELVNNYLLYGKAPTDEEIASVLTPLSQKSRKNTIEEIKKLLHDFYTKFNKTCQEK